MTFVIDEDDYLAHYGILRRSGRYPYGSGGEYVPTYPWSGHTTVRARSRAFLDWVRHMLGMDMTESDIAKGVGLTTAELRAAKSIALNQKKQADINQATRLRDQKGYGPTKIGEIMGIPESTVRTLLAPGAKDKADNIKAVADALRAQVDEKKYLDVGSGVENHLGVARTKLDAAIAYLKEDGGYNLYRIKSPVNSYGRETDQKILTPKDVTWKETVQNKDKIQQVVGYSEDDGRTMLGLYDPLSISSKRVGVLYGEEGAKMDGTIYVRPGVDDISLGGSRYAQVRIAVDGTHYLKGMAVYKDDLPAGIDLQFNTNKTPTRNKLDAMKPLKIDKETGKVDKDNPFGSTIDRQLTAVDKDGNVKTTSVMNIVNDQGRWEKWSKSLSSQVLSKQSPVLAKALLQEDYDRRKKDLDEILALTNPVVKQKLLEAYAESTDTASVHMKAAHMPRQKTQVILPVNSLKDTEIYAPNFKDGENVVLIRYPHGGIFEIPELTVNNRNREGRSLIGSDADDAVGINSKVASRLSGADFDGDTVLVIPNSGPRKFKTAPPLEGLKDFDPQSAYPGYEGMKVMSAAHKQKEMGVASNLVTDMTIRRASDQELAQAVRYTMVVIDAEKHKLNYRQAYLDNNIAGLKEKYQTPYQDSGKAGASTLISRAKSEINVPQRKPRSMGDGGPVDPKTGRKMYEETGDSYVDKNGKLVMRMTKSTRLAETDDAHTLSSGTVIESVYADHSNRLKDLANAARKEAVNTKSPHQSPTARTTYLDAVKSLDAKLDLVERNRPLERQAQIIAATTVKTKKAANPDLTKEDVKKIQTQALKEARYRMGAKSNPVTFTDREWEAIQAGAISSTKLRSLLNKADLEKVRAQATPRTPTVMTSAKQRRADALLKSGKTQAEVAQILGVPLGTLKSSIARG